MAKPSDVLAAVGHGTTEVSLTFLREMKHAEFIASHKASIKQRLFWMSPDSNGRMLTRMLLGKGDLFGDLSFRPRLYVTNERATTSGMACIVEVNRSEIEERSIGDSQFQSLLLQTLSSQVTALDRRLQWQLLSPIRKRIATALYDLLCFSGGRCGHGHLIDIRLTHEEFAELVVAARPVVSEVLAEFKSEQIIDYTRGHICLLSLDRLEAIVGHSHS